MLYDTNVNGPYTFRVFPDTGSAYSLDKAKFKPLFLHARASAGAETW